MLSMLQAARLAGIGKASIHRAIKSGKLSATRREDGTYQIDPAELARVYTIRPETARLEQSGTAGETIPSTDALEVEIRMLREMVEQLRGDRDAWRSQAERLALTDASRRPGGLWSWLRRSA